MSISRWFQFGLDILSNLSVTVHCWHWQAWNSFLILFGCLSFGLQCSRANHRSSDQTYSSFALITPHQRCSSFIAPWVSTRAFQLEGVCVTAMPPNPFEANQNYRAEFVQTWPSVTGSSEQQPRGGTRPRLFPFKYFPPSQLFSIGWIQVLTSLIPIWYFLCRARNYL